MALSLSAAGATIALAARDAEKLNSVKAEIEAAGGKAAVFVTDVVSEASVADGIGPRNCHAARRSGLFPPGSASFSLRAIPSEPSAFV